MEVKAKACKGMGKAFGFAGCGTVTRYRKYGLCQGCLKIWAFNTDAGTDHIERNTINQALPEHTGSSSGPSNRNRLQDLINKVARMIDSRFGYDCIDCGESYAHEKDIHGGHYNGVGANTTLRYNLHNIHTQRAVCNIPQVGGGVQEGYYNGLVERYGQDYADYVDTGIQKEYTYLGLKDADILEKITIVESLIKNFETFRFIDGAHGRNIFNKLIGIYT